MHLLVGFSDWLGMLFGAQLAGGLAVRRGERRRGLRAVGTVGADAGA